MRVGVLFWPALVCALVFTNHASAVEFLWTFSQFLEAPAALPQFVFCYRDTEHRKTPRILVYTLALFGYRTLFGAMWVADYVRDVLHPEARMLDMNSVVTGIAHVVFFVDYFLVFIRKGTSPVSNGVLWIDDSLLEIWNLLTSACNTGLFSQADPDMPTDTVPIIEALKQQMDLFERNNTPAPSVVGRTRGTPGTSLRTTPLQTPRGASEVEMATHQGDGQLVVSANGTKSEGPGNADDDSDTIADGPWFFRREVRLYVRGNRAVAPTKQAPGRPKPDSIASKRMVPWEVGPLEKGKRYAVQMLQGGFIFRGVLTLGIRNVRKQIWSDGDVWHPVETTGEVDEKGWQKVAEHRHEEYFEPKY